MNQSETVENLNRGSRGENAFVKRVLEKRIAQKANPWSDPFPSNLNHISQRFIQPRRFFRKSEFSEKLLQSLFNLFFSNHGFFELMDFLGCQGAKIFIFQNKSLSTDAERMFSGYSRWISI